MMGTIAPNEALMMFRVKGAGTLNYRVAEMSHDQIEERRSLMRQALRGSSWEGKDGPELDAMRLYGTSKGRILEDEEGREYALKDMVEGLNDNFRPAKTILPFDHMDQEAKDFDWNLYGCDIEGPKNLANQYIKGFPKIQAAGMGLFIYSKESGTGKTMLACIILNELRRKYPFSHSFLDAKDIPGLKENSREIKEAKAVDVLVLDDVGTYLSKSAAGVLEGLVSERMGRKLVTIHTSATQISQLKLDEYLRRRLDDSCYQLVLPDVSIAKREGSKRKQELLEEG